MKQASLRLVGDVGGTNVRFALIDQAGPDPRLTRPRSFRCEDFPSLEAAIAYYLPAGGRPASAVVAVAGPVIDGRAELTNGAWRMSETGLMAGGFAAARLLNDYEALALSLRRLGPDDLGAIGEARPRAGGAAALMGAGTGLGVAAVVREGRRDTVLTTEGGHATFAPADEVEMDILRHLSGRFGRVSLERVLSGPGLVNLRWALGRIAGVDVPHLDPEQIVERAGPGGDPLCVQALDRFCGIYGTAAGDLALTFGATGGVYLGGGIAPRILDRLRSGGFRARFEAKGRMKSYVAAIATQVILHPYAALLGAAQAALEPVALEA
ncbi:glucokinase [Caulobacter ginsengisoli]|uniref:Glucokinase n=1 Tax=Caulobacter ginsengisoli TaxID=400775 RepID=A0ABU0IQN9_9CAUL|nr:glucokinase [Caulobacter ginsengisoli]MDQ0464328.1 glucokinase [Caulobacter ginsengisoli]